MSAEEQKSNIESTHEEKIDQVINPEDLFPIKLSRRSQSADDIDAKHNTPPPPPPLPQKMHGDIVPAFREPESHQSAVPSAASVLGLDDGHALGDEALDQHIHCVTSSASVKAFFGGKDTVDAGQESGQTPSYAYDMKHKHRGCFIIFNHMHFRSYLNVNSRKGTDEDKKNLAATAKKLGFEYIRIFDDLGAQDISKWIKKVASADHSNYDCFVMAVLTHGDEGDILYAHDAKYHMDAITEPFMAQNCPSLAGKPKMFFIQACRGVMLDDGAHMRDTVDAKVSEVANKLKKEVMVIPNAADFLLAFSTVPGYYAWRNQACGSWFVQALCKCLAEFGDHLELMQIMTRVNRMVAFDFISYSKKDLLYHGKKQIPSIVTRLTHEVFFQKKNNDRSPSPMREKHRRPVLEKTKHSPDGIVDGTNCSDQKVAVYESKLASLKETHL